MAPGFNNLREDDGDESEDDLDLTGECTIPTKYESGTFLYSHENMRRSPSTI